MDASSRSVVPLTTALLARKGTARPAMRAQFALSADYEAEPGLEPIIAVAGQARTVSFPREAACRLRRRRAS